ncbi:MAG TPA: pitrilysin family protein [Gemmatimonadaceae bacterium]|nr:pitrilysin family protein [Gemmatimonadaceae bacterium]
MIRRIACVPLALMLAAPLSGAAAQRTTSKQSKQSKQSTLDRTVIPTAAKPAELHVPTWTKTTLPNGAELVVSERHTLPLVSFRINFVGGSNQFEPADKTGLAQTVAQMMTEGTTHRSGDQLSNDLQMLGTNLGVSITAEAGTISFQATKDKFAPALAVVSDVLLNPTFPQAALDRLRGRALVSLTQQRDRTSGIAAMVYPKLLYGNNHPYGRVTSESSLKSITRDDVVSFYKNYYEPGRAVITVVGDVKPDQVKALVEQDFAGWARAGSMPQFSYPAPPAAKSTTIYLVDKPGAAQSTFTIGEVGPARATPDYYALRVMNEMLGVLFQSRLNHNIREVKGYSYGVFSNYAFGRGPGPFRAGGDIRTNVTDSALVEFMRELKDIRGDRPPSDDELAQAKASLVQSLPAAFESVGSVNGSIASIYTQGLPEDYYQQFARAVDAVTKDDVVRVARRYIDPDHLAILIVGDRAKIEAPLAATKIAPIVVLDVDGNPVTK